MIDYSVTSGGASIKVHTRDDENDTPTLTGHVLTKEGQKPTIWLQWEEWDHPERGRMQHREVTVFFTPERLRELHQSVGVMLADLEPPE